MTLDLLEEARAGDEDAFRKLVDPHRRELQFHCYRLLGSVSDAEDALQETLLAAWQGLASFEKRSSLRTWLYRIATSRSLNILRARRRRTSSKESSEVPPGLPEPTGSREVPWLQPYPDSLIDGIPDSAPGPEARYEVREAISLAFVTAMQRLPPRQRAVQILRDVLGYRAKEVAEMLSATEESVASAHKRARAAVQLHSVTAGASVNPLPPKSAAEYQVAERFANAFEAGDVDGVVELLTEDVSFAMPPLPFEWCGRDRTSQFLTAIWRAVPVRRLISTRANGQPAFCLYAPDTDRSVLRARGVLVLTLAGLQISAVTRFGEDVVRYFGVASAIESTS